MGDWLTGIAVCVTETYLCILLFITLFNVVSILQSNSDTCDTCGTKFSIQWFALASYSMFIMVWGC